jgi:hypothetical protein
LIADAQLEDGKRVPGYTISIVFCTYATINMF